MKKPWKSVIGGGVLLVLGTILVVVLVLAWPAAETNPIAWGVTFSQSQAEYIGLNWREAYTAILDDLGVRRLRLVAYWNIVEPKEGRYDFTGLDWQMDEAAKRGAKVVLAIGRKVPRWPECHVPDWAREMPEAKQQQEVLDLVSILAQRYGDHPALERWQLENEPFLDFGDCPPSDAAFFDKEQIVLRDLGAGKPIVVTDSGELNSWLQVAKYGDLVGTTMYRTVWSSRTHGPFSYDYIFPAWMYRLKSRYIQLLRGKNVIIAELQGEPWGAAQYPDMTAEERAAVFDKKRMVELAQFAERTQLPEAYWWGVEYWYWEKVKHDNPVFWQEATDLFSH